MYAIVEAGGKQYKAEVGKFFKVEKLDAEVGSVVELNCLFVSGDDGKCQTGNPYVKGVVCKAEVLEQGKEDKIVVFKYKAKKNERKKQGHRQPYTKIKVVSIGK